MAKARISVNFDRDIADLIDEVRCSTVNRTLWISRAVKVCLEDPELIQKCNGEIDD